MCHLNESDCFWYSLNILELKQDFQYFFIRISKFDCHMYIPGGVFLCVFQSTVEKDTRGTCLGAGTNNYQPLWSAGFIPPHIHVSKITWPTSGLQRLCFDLWLNRMNDLRRTAFREDCLAIRLESSDVYALRGVSGWVCAAEILWEKGRYTLPHG